MKSGKGSHLIMGLIAAALVLIALIGYVQSDENYLYIALAVPCLTVTVREFRALFSKDDGEK